jgi:ferredoxin-NADP reductase
VDLVPEIPVPRFRPGQFLHLTVDGYDPAGFWPESRVFSIASGPESRDRVRICYSVKGRYTARMERELHAGSSVWIKLPYGDFVIGDDPEVVLLAGGTGISAFSAFIRGLSPDGARRVHLVYGVRSPELMLDYDVIQERARAVSAFRAVMLTERGRPDAGDGLDRVVFRTGRVSVDAAWPGLDNPLECVYYLSGPPAMLASLTDELLRRGVPPDRVRQDAWE